MWQQTLIDFHITVALEVSFFTNFNPLESEWKRLPQNKCKCNYVIGIEPTSLAISSSKTHWTIALVCVIRTNTSTTILTRSNHLA